jgi:hypothetical protein
MKVSYFYLIVVLCCCVGVIPPPFYPVETNDSGNGSLMRLAPIPIFFHCAGMREVICLCLVVLTPPSNENSLTMEVNFVSTSRFDDSVVARIKF